MEKLMNRIVSTPNLLEDEKLNAKIERLFDNHTFQKMVENTDVFQDISNLSFTNSFFQKNKGAENKGNKQKIMDSSWEIESVPKFGNRNLFFVYLKKLGIFIENESEIAFTGEDSFLNQKNFKEKIPGIIFPLIIDIFLKEKKMQAAENNQQQKEKNKNILKPSIIFPYNYKRKSFKRPISLHERSPNFSRREQRYTINTTSSSKTESIKYCPFHKFLIQSLIYPFS